MTDSGPSPTATSLGQTELRRRLWHMAPGLLPFVLWPIPHRDPLSGTLLGVVAIIAGMIAGSIFGAYRSIQRSDADRERLAAVAGYTLSVLVMLLAFPGAAELGLTVLAVLAFGDGSATFGGLYFRGPKLPWNRRKSWSGLACFIAVGTPLASLIYWGESHNLEARTPGASIPVALACGGSAAIVAALAESVESRINDNVRVGLTAAFTVTLLHTLLVGWPG